MTEHNGEVYAVDHRVDARIGRLEAIVESLTGDIRSLTEFVRSRSQTPWSTLAAWASVIIAVGALAMAPLYYQVRSQEDTLHRMEDLSRATREEHIRDSTGVKVTGEFLLKEQDAIRKTVGELEGRAGVCECLTKRLERGDLGPTNGRCPDGSL